MEARATSSFDGMAPTVPSLLTLLRAAHSPAPAAAATAMTDDGSETRLVAVGEQHYRAIPEKQGSSSSSHERLERPF